jgi:hypothetical protein
MDVLSIKKRYVQDATLIMNMSRQMHDGSAAS